MNIIYYITNHGYGHAVRAAAIANAFSSRVRLTFRTTVPERFFRHEVKRPFDYAPASFDCGCVQKDGLEVDIEKTLAAYCASARENEKKLDSESRWCRERAADCIVSDIAPFPLAVAARISVPGVAVSNFTWYDIYEEYAAAFSGFRQELEKMRAQYAAATLLVSLEPALPMSYFARRFSVTPVGRTGRKRGAELAARYGFDPTRPRALIYFGAYGIRGIDWKELERFPGWEFLGICDLDGAPATYHCVRTTDFPYQDLVASADLIICKLGYGTVAEAMLHGTPLLYPPRRDFAEYPCLDAAIRRRGGGYCLPARQFEALDWRDTLAAVLDAARPPAADSGGAAAGAAAIERCPGFQG